MVALRRTSSTRARYPQSRSGYVSLRRAATLKRKSPAKKKASAKRRVAKKKTTTPVFVPHIKAFMKDLNTFATRRKKNFGASDPLAKAIHNFHTELGRQLKKANIVNPNFAKALKNVKARLRQAPKSLRQSHPKLAKFIKENISKGTANFLKEMKKTIAPLERDLKKLETHIKNEIKRAKNKKIQFKVNPEIKRKYSSMNTQMKNAKAKWNKQLNRLATHGNKTIKTAVNALKKQCDEINKCVSRTKTMINRYSKASKKKKGYTTRSLFTPSQAKACEKKWNQLKSELATYKAKADCFFDQLKSIKLF